MARRDLIQDTDRPHYYSQFWIDVAQGKEKSATAIAEPAAEADDAYPFAAEAADTFEAPEAVVAPVEVVERVEKPEPKSKNKPEKKAEPAAPRSLTSLADLANIDLLMRSSAAMDDDVTPDIEAGATPGLDDSIVTNFDVHAINADDATAAEPAIPADEELDFDEDEEDEEWAARHKPKQAKPKRRERRDF
ncbi:MAG TPA: hypothetical protein VMV29_24070 [Ktedonobacterales bacterium]|nr:hypothetical protein [Ktedonobacterales bacterium]